jgi:phosphopentomutase
MFKRIFLIVMDSVGIGALPDSHLFDDLGAHTFLHTAKSQNGIHVPHLDRLGLGQLVNAPGLNKEKRMPSAYGRMIETSASKDTMTGHWEMMGLQIDSPFRTFTETGFPDGLIKTLEEKTGRKIIGNIAASGTEIIQSLGETHMKTGALIVYTSADSVLQIAAHEEIVPLEELYSACEIARELTLEDPFKIGRIIARPFIGKDKASFKRTANRHDYALKPFSKTTLDFLKEEGYTVAGFGKIADIFDNEGITESYRHDSNEQGMIHFTNYLGHDFEGLAFLNLVDFDALYGHRRDPKGYHQALERFDQQLGDFLTKLKEEDLLIITADHGNDPTYKGTDHTREYVPLLMTSKRFKDSLNLQDITSFASLAAMISDNFKVKKTNNGISFYEQLKTIL